MATQQSKSGLLAKMGNRVTAAHRQAVAKEAEYDSGGRLPAGIESGVAQLIDCTIEPIKKEGPTKGQPQFRAVGIVVSPVEHNGQRVAGMRTSVMIPLYDTPSRVVKTFEGHYEEMLNELKCLFGSGWRQTGFFDGETPQQVEANLFAGMKALVDASPFFKFRTWKGSKQKLENKGGKFWVGAKQYATEEAARADNKYLDSDPLVNEVWGGLIEGYAASNTQAAAAGMTVDNTTASNGQANGHQAPNQVEEPTLPFDDQGDLDTLVTRADSEGEARARLKELAIAKGISEQQVDDSDSWQQVADMILAASSSSEEGESGAEEGAEGTPAYEVGDAFKYQLLDGKGKPVQDPKSKKPRPPVKVELLTVSDTFVTLTNTETGKPILNLATKKPLEVPLDQLLPLG